MSSGSNRYYMYYHSTEPEVTRYTGPLLSPRGARCMPIEGSEANWIYHWEKHLKSQINSCLFNAFPEEVLLSIAADPPLSPHSDSSPPQSLTAYRGHGIRVRGQWAKGYWGPKLSEPHGGLRIEWWMVMFMLRMIGNIKNRIWREHLLDIKN